MSRKSRQPDSGGKGRKGKKGKRKQAESTQYREVVVVEETGPPFGLVVLIALAMALPSLTAFFDGTLEFRPAIIRLLAALLVSWLLCQLVYSVINSFAKETESETTVRTETRDGGEYGGYDGYDGQDRQAS